MVVVTAVAIASFPVVLFAAMAARAIANRGRRRDGSWWDRLD